MSLESSINELAAAINVLAQRFNLPTVNVDDYLEEGDGPTPAIATSPPLLQNEVPSLKRRGRPAGSRNKKPEPPAPKVIEAEAPTPGVPVLPPDPGPRGSETMVIPGETLVSPDPVATVGYGMDPEKNATEVLDTKDPEPTPAPIAVTSTTDPIIHDTIRIEARHLVARGDTPVLQKWLRDLFDVEAISMIPEDRLPEAYASILELVKTQPQLEPAAA